MGNEREEVKRCEVEVGAWGGHEECEGGGGDVREGMSEGGCS